MSQWHAGFVALVGQPNSGKSTLFNQLVGEKISIVTSKPQTTRRRIQGFICQEQTQAIFVDSPGMIRAQRGLNQFLADEWKSVAQDADILVAVLSPDVTDARELDQVLTFVRQSGKPWMAYISKTDLPLEGRVRQTQSWLELEKIPVICGNMHISSEVLQKDFLNILRPLLPQSPRPLFDVETLTTATVRDICGELIREAAFEVLHQELPYSIAVHILKFDESGPIVRIYAELWVAKENHKKIVVGRQAQTIKSIGIKARQKIEALVDNRVFLDLQVKLKQDWMESAPLMRELGYEVSPEARKST